MENLTISSRIQQRRKMQSDLFGEQVQVSKIIQQQTFRKHNDISAGMEKELIDQQNQSNQINCAWLRILITMLVQLVSH